MDKRYIIALDAGTTSVRTLVYDIGEEKIVCTVSEHFEQIYPNLGWVEHDPEEIWTAITKTIKEAYSMQKIAAGEVAAIGITNQRETVVVWDKFTGEPIYNAIVWQCRRTAEYCTQLSKSDTSEMIKSKTGLRPDAYFSATKIKWILDNVEGARERAKNGDLLAGTIDTYLIWRLSGKKSFVTDPSNASRTMLYNIDSGEWDRELCEMFGVPVSMLAKVVESSGIAAYALIGNERIPVSGIAGDQQAALFGQACFNRAMAKNTYGTGCFILANTGEKRCSEEDLLTTIAWRINGKPTYALEGSIFNAGSVVQWLRDNMGLIQKSSDTEEICLSISDNGGVYFVPAFTGLGAPYWDMDARGTIVGLTRGSTKAEIVRAAMESMAYNTKAIVDKMRIALDTEIAQLRCDGGVSKDNFLMQFQSDMLGCDIVRQSSHECTAMGAVYLAGLGVGIFKSLEEIESKIKITRKYSPSMDVATRDRYYAGWIDAIGHTRSEEGGRK